jgi:phage shock protein PspC (stress-responsive transcriptional regulator)
MMNDIRRTFAQHGLVRARQGKVLGGVAGGLGRRIGIEPWPSRLLFVLLLLLVPGSQILVYPALWILMPSEEKAAELGFGTPTPRTPAPVTPTA